MLGLQASIPLYTGGATALRAAEAAAAVRRAEAQLAQTRSQLDQQIQQASLQLDSLREQQRALDQAVMASQKHLEATRTGRQVGDRTPQDVLNAEQAVASLQHQRDQASTQYLLVWLQLAALKGQLNGQVLQQLSAS
jgi:outer membrane protein